MEIEFVNKFEIIIIVGDINIDVLVQFKGHTLFNNMLKCNNMNYLLKFPTIVTSLSKTVIDNFIITKAHSNLLNVNSVMTLLSDHGGQCLETMLDNLNNLI